MYGATSRNARESFRFFAICVFTSLRRTMHACRENAPKESPTWKKMHELLKERTKERKEETPVVANKKNIGAIKPVLEKNVKRITFT